MYLVCTIFVYVLHLLSLRRSCQTSFEDIELGVQKMDGEVNTMCLYTMLSFGREIL